MKALTYTLIATLAVAVLAPSFAAADWNPGDGHKMHFPQLPDPNGWDVNVTFDTMYDDWQCSESGPVNDVHFWGSWQGDIQSNLLWLEISIWSDMSATDPNNPLPYSHPDKELWIRRFLPSEFTVRGPFTGQQGWLDPQPPDKPTVLPNDHNRFWQVNIQDIMNPFVQQRGQVYWLGIHAGPAEASTQFGWKTSLEQWNDDAAFWYTIPDTAPPHWRELIDPLTGQSLDMAFVITPEPATLTLLALGAMAVLRRR